MITVNLVSYSVYQNSHNASVIASVPVPFQMHDGSYDVAITIS